MISFGSYLKDYLEYNNISQSEFALRLGITQKHMNEILAGKQNISKIDYSIAQSKTIIDGDEYREKRADEFAIKTMISDFNWNEIIKFNLNEKDILNYSRKNKICMSFIVGRLAKEKYINYNSNFYNKYKNM